MHRSRITRSSLHSGDENALSLCGTQPGRNWLERPWPIGGPVLARAEDVSALADCYFSADILGPRWAVKRVNFTPRGFYGFGCISAECQSSLAGNRVLMSYLCCRKFRMMILWLSECCPGAAHAIRAGNTTCPCQGPWGISPFLSQLPQEEARVVSRCDLRICGGKCLPDFPHEFRSEERSFTDLREQRSACGNPFMILQNPHKLYE